MVEIISVRFKEGGKQYYFNPNGQQFQVGDGVIVDTTRGTEYGLCTHGNSMIDEIELMAPLRPVVRNPGGQADPGAEQGEGEKGLRHLPGEDRPARAGHEAGGGGV